MAFAELDRSSGDAVQQGGGSRVVGGPARREYRRARSRGRVQALAQLPHLGPLRPREDDADRVEHDQLRIPLHFRRHLLERRLGDKMSELFDLLCHSRSCRLGVEPAANSSSGIASPGWAQRAL